MSDDMTNGEIARQLADLKTQVGIGFQGTHGRLDKVNGQLDIHREKLGEHATALAEHRVKLSTLNGHVFRRSATSEDAAAESRPVTRADLALVGGALFALIELVRWLPALLSAGKVAP
jgi:hypothetical protein